MLRPLSSRPFCRARAPRHSLIIRDSGRYSREERLKARTPILAGQMQKERDDTTRLALIASAGDEPLPL